MVFGLIFNLILQPMVFGLIFILVLQTFRTNYHRNTIDYRF